MKQNKKIYMQSWLQCHSHTTVESTDEWYLGFANRLFPLIESSRLYKNGNLKEQQHAAVLLTLYLEDCVAEAGGWKRFSDLYHKRYGAYLPFYKIPADYIPDEINEVDIAFVLWKLNSDDDFFATVANPFDEKLLELAAGVYRFLNDEFEQAPICDTPSGDWVLPSEQLLKERTIIPEIQPGVQLPKDVQLFLEATGGEQLMYFATYEEMEAFFVTRLHWNAKDIPNKLDAEVGNVVVFANPKGILVAPGASWFFCDKRNQVTYDRVIAIEEGYKVFTDKGYCPFDLLKYAVEHNLFPEARLPFENGKELLWDNWDFIARWFLGDYYEGR